MVTSDSTPNIWTHVAAKGAHNRHGIVDNRIEVVPRGHRMTTHRGFSLLSTT